MFHFNHIIAYHWYQHFVLLSPRSRQYHANLYIHYVALNDQEDEDLWFEELKARSHTNA
jgi:hypothetical protein